MLKQLLLPIILAVGGLPLAAQPSLEYCREKARENYPTVRKYDLIQRTEHLNISDAARAWLPQVAFSAQASYQSDVVHWPEEFERMLSTVGVEMPGLQKDQYRIQLDIQQNIWDGGKSRSDKMVAKADAEQSRRNADVELYELESRVESIYFGILMMQEQGRQMEEMTGRLKNNLDRVEALVESGVALQEDVDAVQVSLLTTKQNLSQIRSKEKAYRRMLEIFIGEPVGAEPLETPQIVESTSPGPSLRPELRLFDAQLDLLQAKKKAVDVALMPRFSLFAQGYYGYPGLNMFENMMNRNWSLNGIVGIRMNWNISSFWFSSNTRRKLDDSMEAVRISREVFDFNNSLNVLNGSEEIDRLREALEDDCRIVSLKTGIREAAEAKLEEGIIDVSSLLDKISEETVSIIARNTREIELIKAIYDLKHTLNN